MSHAPLTNLHPPTRDPRRRLGAIQNLRAIAATLVAVAFLAVSGGCLQTPVFVSPADQKIIDRSVVETPADTQLTVIATGLTAPTAFCFDPSDGTMFIANNGHREGKPHIFGVRPDRTTFEIYPTGKRVPGLEFLTPGFNVVGPIGGMVFHNGRLYVTHRDEDGKGVVTAFGMDGSHTTIVADFPAQGDYSLTDITVRPSDGRLFFGIGSATNSSVVGLDNFQIGWPRKFPNVCDLSFVELFLNGYRFDTRNPNAGLFRPEIVVTAPFQKFGESNETTVLPAPDGKPNAAIFSVSATGGDLKVEAHGMHLPRGLAFSDYGRLYAVNDGMELRGTRPVKNDPDSLVRVILGVTPTWYGWPDFSSDLLPISDPRFQEEGLLRPSGYGSLRPVIDRDASNPPNKLKAPDRELMLHGVFPSQSGGAKLAFVPNDGPFKELHGSAIVALAGDRAPFATSGFKLRGYFGYRVVRVDVDEKTVSDFIVNTSRMPASKMDRGTVALERPIDVKIGPDGSIYILDFGQMTVKNGQESISRGTGKIFKLSPALPTVPPPKPSPATQPLSGMPTSRQTMP